jgi:hypothetical protein
MTNYQAYVSDAACSIMSFTYNDNIQNGEADPAFMCKYTIFPRRTKLMDLTPRVGGRSEQFQDLCVISETS